MIGKIVDHIVGELNYYLRLLSSVESDHVVAGSLFDVEGGPNAKVKDKTVLSLVKVEQDRTYPSQEIYKAGESRGTQLIKPPITVNLFFLIIANYSNYQEALKAISRVITFFQHRVSFDIETDITHPGSIRRPIVFDMVSMNFEQQNHLWGMLGNKYIPSVLYKAGLVSLQDEQVEAIVAPVEEIHINE